MCKFAFYLTFWCPLISSTDFLSFAALTRGPKRFGARQRQQQQFMRIELQKLHYIIAHLCETRSDRFWWKEITQQVAFAAAIIIIRAFQFHLLDKAVIG